MKYIATMVGGILLLIAVCAGAQPTQPPTEHSDQMYQFLLDKDQEWYLFDVACADSTELAFLQRVCDTVRAMAGKDRYMIVVSREGLKLMRRTRFDITPLAYSKPHQDTPTITSKPRPRPEHPSRFLPPEIRDILTSPGEPREKNDLVQLTPVTEFDSLLRSHDDSLGPGNVVVETQKKRWDISAHIIEGARSGDRVRIAFHATALNYDSSQAPVHFSASTRGAIWRLEDQQTLWPQHLDSSATWYLTVAPDRLDTATIEISIAECELGWPRKTTFSLVPDADSLVIHRKILQPNPVADSTITPIVSSSHTTVSPGDYGIRVTEKGKDSDPITLEFYFVPPKGGCRQMTIIPRSLCCLTYMGPDSVIVPVTKDRVTRWQFQVCPDPCDTSGIQLLVQGCDNRLSLFSSLCFVPTGDGIVVASGNPWRQSRGEDTPDGYAAATVLPYRCSYCDPPLSEQSQEKIDAKLKDYAKERDRRLMIREIERIGTMMEAAQKARFEQAPLTELETQQIRVGDTLFSRSQGETQFHPIEIRQSPPLPLTIPGEHQYLREASFGGSGAFHLAIECPDSACIGFLQEIADTVWKAPGSDRYQITVRGGALARLRERGYRLLTGAAYDRNFGRKMITVTAAKVVLDFKSSKHRIRPEDDPGMRVRRQDVAGLLRAVEAKRAAAARADSSTFTIRRGNRYFCPAP